MDDKYLEGTLPQKFQLMRVRDMAAMQLKATWNLATSIRFIVWCFAGGALLWFALDPILGFKFRPFGVILWAYLGAIGSVASVAMLRNLIVVFVAVRQRAPFRLVWEAVFVHKIAGHHEDFYRLSRAELERFVRAQRDTSRLAMAIARFVFRLR